MDCQHATAIDGGHLCGPGGRRPGRRVSFGVCRACLGLPPAKPRMTLAGLVQEHAARRTGCAECRKKHAARLAAQRAAK